MYYYPVDCMYTAKTGGLHEPKMGFLSCTAACPMMLRSGVTMFMCTILHIKMPSINEVVVILSAVKRTMVHYNFVSIIILGTCDRTSNHYTHCLFCYNIIQSIIILLLRNISSLCR